MGPGQGQIAGDCVLIDLCQAAGSPRAAAFAEVTQHRGDLLVGESRLFQDGPLALREASLTGAAVHHADAFSLATPAAEGEISLAPTARIGAMGILAAEALDGLHEDPSRSERLRSTPLVSMTPSLRE